MHGDYFGVQSKNILVRKPINTVPASVTLSVIYIFSELAIDMVLLIDIVTERLHFKSSR